jgi:RNA polymerase sigma-54 factor
MELKLSAKLTQKLVMTPILQQVIKLLPMTRMELVTAIRQEMEENPFLEELEADENEESKDQQEAEGGPEEKPADGFEEEVSLNTKEEKKSEEIDWDSYFQEEAYDGATGEGYEDKPSLENTLRTSESLQDHLLWQLHLTVQDQKKRLLGEIIISEIDSDGFFKGELKDVAEQAGMPIETAKEVLETIKEKFEPTGVGASDIRECLMLQAESLEPDDPIVRELIEDHLPNLTERNYAKIAKELDVDVERVMEAVEFIRSLDPAPGKSFNTEKAHYVIPDIYLVQVNGEYQVILNDDGMPRLRINSYYKSILKGNRSVQAKTREFVENKFKAAIWLIKSIEQRRQTMLKVGNSIVKFQRGFLDHGISHLKPLVLRNVAEDIGMHESTISRVTRNKYIHTPQGIVELKFFFHSGVNSYLGSSVSSVRVKEMIKKIVLEEEIKKPVTDDQIVRMLQTQDVKIARRTVTKYRKELGIPPASKRKRIY